MASESMREKSRARRAVLWYLTQFCISHVWGNGDQKRITGNLHGFRSDISTQPEPGDLVILKSAPISKWNLGWLHEIETREHGWKHYLIESLDDGSMCWWSNVGIDHLERDLVAEHPEWRWTDRQFEFADRWTRVCREKRDAYITLPVPPTFGEGFEVTLGTRTRHGFDDHRPQKTFPDWRKVTKATMLEFYDECVAARAAKDGA